jgi:class 3 adenylate cyclase
MLGTIGNAARMEGTVISNTVNLASRFEGIAKFFNVSLVTSS